MIRSYNRKLREGYRRPNRYHNLHESRRYFGRRFLNESLEEVIEIDFTDLISGTEHPEWLEPMLNAGRQFALDIDEIRDYFITQLTKAPFVANVKATEWRNAKNWSYESEVTFQLTQREDIRGLLQEILDSQYKATYRNSFIYDVATILLVSGGDLIIELMDDDSKRCRVAFIARMEPLTPKKLNLK